MHASTITHTARLPHGFPRLLQALDALDLAPGTISNVLVEHDPDCPFNRGAMCSCRPDMSVFADGNVRVTGEEGEVEVVRAS